MLLVTNLYIYSQAICQGHPWNHTVIVGCLLNYQLHPGAAQPGRIVQDVVDGETPEPHSIVWVANARSDPAAACIEAKAVATEPAQDVRAATIVRPRLLLL